MRLMHENFAFFMFTLHTGECLVVNKVHDTGYSIVGGGAIGDTIVQFFLPCFKNFGDDLVVSH